MRLKWYKVSCCSGMLSSVLGSLVKGVTLALTRLARRPCRIYSSRRVSNNRIIDCSHHSAIQMIRHVHLVSKILKHMIRWPVLTSPSPSNSKQHDRPTYSHVIVLSETNTQHALCNPSSPRSYQKSTHTHAHTPYIMQEKNPLGPSPVMRAP
jgi:hypothetical protein